MDKWLRLAAWAVVGLVTALGVTLPISAQGSLSEQVLRLLVRDNSWSGVNTFTHDRGVLLEAGTAPSPTSNRLYNIGGNLYFNGTLVATSAGAGTVTSVGLTVPAILSVAGSPVTSSGTLAMTLATETANTVFAGGTSGGAATPTFRALVAADIPNISATYLTASSSAALTNKTGNISQWTNDSGYLTSTGTGSASWSTVGTVTTGVWNATIVAGLYGGTGVANSGKTIMLGGNLTTSGANAVTFTTSGTTNVTLPTSGTLLSSTVTTLSSLVSIGTITTGVWNGTAIGGGYGGTGLATYAVGDLLYASASTTLAKLADIATGNALISGGVTTAPAWGKIGLTTHISGTLAVGNGGTGITTTPSNGFLPIGNGTNYTAAALTGTASQITVTNGSGSITLATPQGIATTSTPQFARMGLGAAAGSSAKLTVAGDLDLGFIDDGNSSTADTIDWSTGGTHKSTLTGNVVYTFSNPIAGRSYTLFVIQDATGSRTVTWPGTVTWKGGAAPTLTATVNKTDICYFRWNGTAYLANCDLLF